MMNNNGSLNSLGSLYIGADSVEASGPATNSAAGSPVGGPGGFATVSAAPGSAPTFATNGARSVGTSATWIRDVMGGWGVVSAVAGCVMWTSMWGP